MKLASACPQDLLEGAGGHSIQARNSAPIELTSRPSPAPPAPLRALLPSIPSPEPTARDRGSRPGGKPTSEPPRSLGPLCSATRWSCAYHPARPDSAQIGQRTASRALSAPRPRIHVDQSFQAGTAQDLAPHRPQQLFLSTATNLSSAAYTPPTPDTATSFLCCSN